MYDTQFISVAETYKLFRLINITEYVRYRHNNFALRNSVYTVHFMFFTLLIGDVYSVYTVFSYIYSSISVCRSSETVSPV